MWFLLFYLGNIVKQKADAISNGQTPEQIQQMLLNMQSGQSEALLANIQSFVFIFIVCLVVIVVGGLFLFSLSRKLIWSRLTGRRFGKKKYWKWNLLNLSLVIPAIVYLFLLGLVRLIFGNILSLLKNQTILDVFYSIFNLFLFFTLIIFIFLIYYSFTEKYKIWDSIGDASQIVKSKWKRIWPMFLLIVFTAFILSSVLLLVMKIFKFQANILTGMNLVVSLLFLAWMRIYVYKTIKNEPETTH